MNTMIRQHSLVFYVFFKDLKIGASCKWKESAERDICFLSPGSVVLAAGVIRLPILGCVQSMETSILKEMLTTIMLMAVWGPGGKRWGQRKDQRKTDKRGMSSTDSSTDMWHNMFRTPSSCERSLGAMVISKDMHRICKRVNDCIVYQYPTMLLAKGEYWKLEA